MRILRFGVDGVLVEFADLASARSAAARLRATELSGVTELVPGARTVLVRFEPRGFSPSALTDLLDGDDAGSAEPASGALIEIPVRYDGQDLRDVAHLVGVSVDEVIRRHTAPTYDVAFTGFAPGFAYLSGGDPLLAVARRSSPRTAIPAGSVGLAGEFSGVYPRESPGGWQLLGATSLAPWDSSRAERPALLQPGDRVRFVQSANESISVSAATAAPHRLAAANGIVVEQVGLFASIQDLGRPDFAALGVPASGAMDRNELRRANRLVGNSPGAAAIEFLGDLTVVARSRVAIAATGNVEGLLLVSPDGDETELEPDLPHALDDGDRLELTAATSSVYAYLAVSGGIVAPQTLGSASTDVLSGLGPAPIAAGDTIEVGSAHQSAVADAPDPAPAPSNNELDVVLGPRDDWFDTHTVDAFFAQSWEITGRSNRVGIRLRGETPLLRSRTDELPSEGMRRGAIQVPPDGQPVVFGADSPVTGGYPVIGALTPEAFTRLVRTPFGGSVKFRRAD